MARWQGGTFERLQGAALELFAKNGFDETTAAQIAEAAGVTERTFYRHFSDKREVLFAGSELLVEDFRKGIQDAPEGASAFEMVESALGAITIYFSDVRRPYSRQRQQIIQANPALEERELHKAMTIVHTLREELLARGIPETAAALAAQTASTVFSLAFARWIQPDETRSMGAIQNELMADLRNLVR
jgi:AcrR family transcriptional regulator